MSIPSSFQLTPEQIRNYLLMQMAESLLKPVSISLKQLDTRSLLDRLYIPPLLKSISQPIGLTKQEKNLETTVVKFKYEICRLLLQISTESQKSPLKNQRIKGQFSSFNDEKFIFFLPLVSFHLEKILHQVKQALQMLDTKQDPKLEQAPLQIFLQKWAEVFSQKQPIQKKEETTHKAKENLDFSTHQSSIPAKGSRVQKKFAQQLYEPLRKDSEKIGPSIKSPKIQSVLLPKIENKALPVVFSKYLVEKSNHLPTPIAPKPLIKKKLPLSFLAVVEAEPKEETKKQLIIKPLSSQTPRNSNLSLIQSEKEKFLFSLISNKEHSFPHEESQVLESQILSEHSLVELLEPKKIPKQAVLDPVPQQTFKEKLFSQSEVKHSVTTARQSVLQNDLELEKESPQILKTFSRKEFQKPFLNERGEVLETTLKGIKNPLTEERHLIKASEGRLFLKEKHPLKIADKKSIEERPFSAKSHAPLFSTPKPSSPHLFGSRFVLLPSESFRSQEGINSPSSISIGPYTINPLNPLLSKKKKKTSRDRKKEDRENEKEKN